MTGRAVAFACAEVIGDHPAARDGCAGHGGVEGPDATGHDRVAVVG